MQIGISPTEFFKAFIFLVQGELQVVDAMTATLTSRFIAVTFHQHSQKFCTFLAQRHKKIAKRGNIFLEFQRRSKISCFFFWSGNWHWKWNSSQRPFWRCNNFIVWPSLPSFIRPSVSPVALCLSFPFIPRCLPPIHPFRHPSPRSSSSSFWVRNVNMLLFFRDWNGIADRFLFTPTAFGMADNNEKTSCCCCRCCCCCCWSLRNLIGFEWTRSWTFLIRFQNQNRCCCCCCCCCSCCWQYEEVVQMCLARVRN